MVKCEDCQNTAKTERDMKEVGWIRCKYRPKTGEYVSIYFLRECKDYRGNDAKVQGMP